jgi:predicted nucleic acid-binding protein
MTFFVDTSVWSLAWRRDTPTDDARLGTLLQALEGESLVVSTGLVLQELLQGFQGPKAADRIISAFASLPLIFPDREDHIEAARLRNHCRRKGFQVGTIDALLAQLCLRHDLVMLTTDEDFRHMAAQCALRLAPSQ